MKRGKIVFYAVKGNNKFCAVIDSNKFYVFKGKNKITSCQGLINSLVSLAD